MAAELRIIPIALADEIRPGDSLAQKLVSAIKANKLTPKAGDILIVKHKVVSKAEGAMVPLDSITPSSSSREWGRRYDLDPRTERHNAGDVFRASVGRRLVAEHPALRIPS